MRISVWSSDVCSSDRGGANPPTPGFATKEEQTALAKAAGASDFTFLIWDALGYLPSLQLFANEYGDTFKPEFVNAFEVGAKNSFMNGARSEEHTSELQSLMRISYAVFCLKKKKHNK